MAALLGLLAQLCVGQDPVPPNPTPQNQPSGNPAPQNQSPQSQPIVPRINLSRISRLPRTSLSRISRQTFLPQIAKPGAEALQGPFSARATPIALDSNETLFAVLTALNSCGYDQDLTTSDATRSNVRAEVQTGFSGFGRSGSRTDCDVRVLPGSYLRENPTRSLSPYISLALYMDGPPHFAPRVKEEDLPPDAVLITGFGTLLERFYEKAGLHSIWERHRRRLCGR